MSQAFAYGFVTKFFFYEHRSVPRENPELQETYLLQISTAF